MFNPGPWFRNMQDELSILNKELKKVKAEQQRINKEMKQNQPNKLQFDQHQENLQQLNAKIDMLQHAIHRRFSSNDDNHQLERTIARQSPNLTIGSDILSSTIPGTRIYINRNIMNGTVNAIYKNHNIMRIESSNVDKDNSEFLYHGLVKEWESQKEMQRIREIRRNRWNVNKTIYHIMPEVSDAQCNQWTDSAQPATIDNGIRIEDIWLNSLDDAFQRFTDGDVIQLGEGEHVFSGLYPIFGQVLIEGLATSNWKTCIVNTSESLQCIWAIGKHTRVTLRNVIIRCCGGHNGIIRVSLRAQCIADNVIMNCNGLEGIHLEHESKVWLNGCCLLNVVGAGIHLNAGSKCLLSNTTLLDAGQGDDNTRYGQGGVVIHGDGEGYAKHLVKFLTLCS